MKRTGLLVGALSFSGFCSGISIADKGYFNWSNVEAYDDINYTDCYDGYKCAKLKLPLDWLDLSNPNNVAIAITMLPAKVDIDDPSFGGTVILNPGGPSNSGVSWIRQAGRSVQRIVDGTKHFNILSFDPRGVSFSEPSAACFINSHVLELWNAESNAVGHLDDSSTAMRTKFAGYKAQGLLCASKDGFSNGDKIQNFMSTPSVARDVVAIAEKMDDLRRQITTHSTGHQRPAFHSDIQKALSGEKKQSLVQYWGFSYGTILGNTLASLFPEKVGRVILDGVADAPDFMMTGWAKNLQDTEKTMFRFYELCFSGGPGCPLYRSTDQGPDNIKSRLENVLKELKQSPIPIAQDGYARLITYSDVRSVVFNALYRPYAKFPEIATAINEMMHGNYTSILKALPRNGRISPDDPDYNIQFPHNDESYDWSNEAQAAIACGDGIDLSNSTLDDFQQFYDLLVAQSPTAGAQWSEIRLACMGWPTVLRPKWRFPGPFVTGGSNRTNHPILLIGNTHDPVTPLRNAVAASAGHEGSVVLTQNSPGHCSVFATSNACTASHVRAYFNDGVLPPPGTVCEEECFPWTDKTCNIDSSVY